MRVIVEDNYANVCNWVAHYIKIKIQRHNNTTSRNFVLGLPTGSTPLGVYKKLIQFCKDGSLSFQNVVTFNMDEYVGLSAIHAQSYSHFMHSNFFNHIDIVPENIHLLNGMASDLQQECACYESKIKKYGGIDLFLCGIGTDGHIAFNEPGSSLHSVTRIKTLSHETIVSNARFFDYIQDVPKQALTVGIKTIMDAAEIIMMANGMHKANAVRECVEGSISNQYTATMIQMHPKAIIICDELATNELKVKTCKYYKNIQHSVNLIGEHYVCPITKYIKHTDTIMITSPHPDDDVIGVGGMMQSLSNKTRTQIVYMTNGAGGLLDATINRIREAFAAVRVLGYSTNQVLCPIFPFYKRKDRKVTQRDYDECSQLLNLHNPVHLFVCIDKDPNGTHHKCYDIIRNSMLPTSIQHIWLYKSAWENWNDTSVKPNCVIPMSNETYKQKLLSIDMHISQSIPVVSDCKNKTFIERTKENNTCDMYPNTYVEKFRIIDVAEFKNLTM